MSPLKSPAKALTKRLVPNLALKPRWILARS